jgi:hypothetical protein
LCFAVIASGLAAAADRSDSESTIVAEAEEFAVQPGTQANGGWKSKAWGENYYCATFGNTFLSRKAFLGAPEQSSGPSATMKVKIPKGVGTWRLRDTKPLRVSRRSFTCGSSRRGA